MKKLLPLIFLLSLSCNIEQNLEIQWAEGFPQDFTTHNKIIMVDFYGKLCTPCERMFKETFSVKDVIQFCEKNFDCYKLMTWTNENKNYQIKNRVYEVPTIIFFNKEGEEIERLTGFIQPEKFYKELIRIYQGKNTYLTLKNNLKEDPNNQEIIYELAIREARIGRKGDKESQKLWKRLANVSGPATYKHDYALLNYYTGILWKNENPDSLIQLIEKIKDFDFNVDGYKTVVDYYRSKDNNELEKKYYKKYSDLVYDKKSVDEKFLKFLNGYALRMSEFNINIPDALEKINFVVSNLPDSFSNYEKAEILYSKAEILIKSDQNNEALELIKQCLKLLPDNEYLIEKKNGLKKIVP